MSEKGTAEPESVGNPIEEQYFPQFTTSRVPSSSADEEVGNLKAPCASEPKVYSEEPSELSDIDEQGL